MKILITGANGFIARNLIAYLTSEQLKMNQKFKRFKNLEIIGIYRDENKLNQTTGVCNLIALNEIKEIIDQTDGCSLDLYQFDLTKLDSSNSLSSVVSNFNSIDCIIHAAGLAHRDLKAQQNQRIYDAINFKITEKLAQLALQYQIKQFLFLSTSKVFSDYAIDGDSIFSIESKPKPKDAYSKSKLKAELCLKKLFANQSSTHYTILRLPLVYGSGATANFEKLWNAVNQFKLLPTGSLNNKRSMIGVLNLTDLIVQLINHPKAVNQSLIPTDKKILSLNELLSQIAKTQNKTIHQIKIPRSSIFFILKLLGKRKTINRLLNDFKLKSHYGKIKWKPPFKFEENFRNWALFHAVNFQQSEKENHQ